MRNMLNSIRITPIKIVMLVIVIAVHVTSIIYLLHARQRKTMEPTATSIKTRIIADIKTNSEKLLPQPLSLSTQTLATTAPDLEITPSAAIDNAPPPLQLATNMAHKLDVPIIASTGPRPDPAIKNTFPADAYPAAALRAHQQGTVTLSLQILEDGSVNDAQIEHSSGFPILDNAAARYARQHWRFIAGTRNGEPVVDWRQVSVIFAANEIIVRY
jgi:TonB family protein